MIGYVLEIFFLEIPTFPPIERGKLRSRKFKEILHLVANDMFLFSFEFPTLEVLERQ